MWGASWCVCVLFVHYPGLCQHFSMAALVLAASGNWLFSTAVVADFVCLGGCPPLHLALPHGSAAPPFGGRPCGPPLNYLWAWVQWTCNGLGTIIYEIYASTCYEIHERLTGFAHMSPLLLLRDLCTCLSSHRGIYAPALTAQT